MELGVRAVERRIAAAAEVGALLEEIVVFAGARVLRALMQDDALLLGGERVKFHGDLVSKP